MQASRPLALRNEGQEQLGHEKATFLSPARVRCLPAPLPANTATLSSFAVPKTTNIHKSIEKPKHAFIKAESVV